MQWPDNQKPEAWGITAFEADTGAHGLSRDPKKIHTGMNSGFAAVNLAYHLGATRILLLGYDMQLDGDKRHWFGAHPAGMEVDSNYPDFINAFKTTLPVEQYGIEVWNCTRKTALHCYPCHDLDEVVERLNGADPEKIQQPGGDSLRYGAVDYARSDRCG